MNRQLLYEQEIRDLKLALADAAQRIMQNPSDVMELSQACMGLVMMMYSLLCEDKAEVENLFRQMAENTDYLSPEELEKILNTTH